MNYWSSIRTRGRVTFVSFYDCMNGTSLLLILFPSNLFIFFSRAKAMCALLIRSAADDTTRPVFSSVIPLLRLLSRRRDECPFRLHRLYVCPRHRGRPWTHDTLGRAYTPFPPLPDPDGRRMHSGAATNTAPLCVKIIFSANNIAIGVNTASGYYRREKRNDETSSDYCVRANRANRTWKRDTRKAWCWYDYLRDVFAVLFSQTGGKRRAVPECLVGRVTR